MDEVFGVENICSIISFYKTTSASADLLPTVADYILGMRAIAIISGIDKCIFRAWARVG
jgi:hypothetical protein